MKKAAPPKYKYTVTYDVPSGAKGRYIVEAFNMSDARVTASRELARLGVASLKIIGVVAIKKGSRR